MLGSRVRAPAGSRNFERQPKQKASVVLFCIVWSCASTRHPLQIKTLHCRSVVPRSPVRHFIEGCGNKKILIFRGIPAPPKHALAVEPRRDHGDLNDSRSFFASVVFLCSQCAYKSAPAFILTLTKKDDSLWIVCYCKNLRCVGDSTARSVKPKYLLE